KELKHTIFISFFRAYALFLCCLCFLLVDNFISSSASGASLSLAWTNNLLTISGPAVPGEKIEVWYLEAFCRKGATDRDWNKTTLPHKTKLVSAEPHRLRFATTVEPNVEMQHEVRARSDEVEFQFELKNHGDQAVDIDWFEPACIRVERFTGLNQSNYI